MTHHLKHWLERAHREGFAIGAFNVSSAELLRAIIEAAVTKESPVIIESSDGETEYLGAKNLVDLVNNAREETRLPIFLNLDHARSVDRVQIALDAGYDLVHYDGSKESPEVNLKNLQTVVKRAHGIGSLVEGERDYIIEGSAVRKITAAAGRAQSHMTDPEVAAIFVKNSRLDIFAVSIGNVHGLYTSPKILDLKLLAEIQEKVPSFLSLHGGSGIDDEQIRQAIEIGQFVKINVSTELRQAVRAGLERELKEHPDEVAMYKLMPDALREVQMIVEAKMELFGSAGKARISHV